MPLVERRRENRLVVFGENTVERCKAAGVRALAPDASLAPRPTAEVECFWAVDGVPNTVAAIVVNKLMLRVPPSAMCAVVERERRAGDVDGDRDVERVLVNLNALNKNFDITGDVARLTRKWTPARSY